MNTYQVFGREWTTDYWQRRGDFTSKQVALRFAREWLSGRCLGQSEVVIYKLQGESWQFPLEIAHYRLDEDGKIQSLEICQ